MGIALPDLAALLRPVLTPAVIGTLAAALLRLDWAQLREAARRPGLLAAITGFQLVVSPLLFWLFATSIGLPADLAVSLVLQAAASPIGSAAVFAMILGLDGALAMIGAVAGTLLLPVSLTAVVALLLPHAGVQVDLAAFFARVSLLVAAPFALTLLACIFAPWGMAAAGAGLAAYGFGMAVYLAKLAFGGLLLALFETSVAKMRVFRVDEFLGAALMLGLLGALLLFVSRGL